MRHTFPALCFHQLMRFFGIAGIHERHQDGAELFEVDGLCQKRVEARIHTLLIDITKNICRERDDWQVRVFMLSFPIADVLAGLVSILVKIAGTATGVLRSIALLVTRWSGLWIAYCIC